MNLSGARANWDYFTVPEGSKAAWIREIGDHEAVLCCNHPIEERRWIRVVLHAEGGIARAVHARVLEQAEIIDLWEDETLTLYRHHLQWIRPLEPEWVGILSQGDWVECACSNLIPRSAVQKDSAQALCGLCALKESVFSKLS